MAIQIKELSQEEFDQIKALSKHIRNFEHFDMYVVLDNSIGHHLYGETWEEETHLMEAMIFNLHRLLQEKGSTPTEDDLFDYLTNHKEELLWNPEYVKHVFNEAALNTIKSQRVI